MRGLHWRAACLPVLLAALLSAAACAAPVVYMDPAATEVWTGDDSWVDVSVNAELLGLTGYDLIIDYDEDVLEVLDAVEGALPQSAGPSFFYWTSGPAPENAIAINGAILGDSVDGPGVLASLHFSGLAAGVSPLEFLTFELRDLENAPIPATASDGVVTVTDHPTIYLTPETTTAPEGTTFAIDVAINESVTGLTGYSLRIQLDSAVVTHLGAVEGPLPPTGGPTAFEWILEDANVINIDGVVLGGWVDGPGVLAHVDLSALYQGVTDMVFLSVDLRDIDNNPIPAFDEGAVITVTPGGTPVKDTSWSRVKSLYR